MITKTFRWTAGALGAVADMEIPAGDIKEMYLYAMVTIPGADAAAPDANYDITVEDVDKFDVLGGAGANRSSTNKEIVSPLIGTAAKPVPVDGILTVKIANNTNANATGVIKLYFDNYPR